MPKRKYQPCKIRKSGLARVEAANAIIKEYQDDGYQMTLRQLYYQLVARGQLENTDKNYASLSVLMNSARLAGLVDWDAIVDLTRRVRKLSHYFSPAHMIKKSIPSYNRDLWSKQDIIPEVWIEKDALLGVIEQTCLNNDVPYFACRGYTSVTGLYEAGQRFARRISSGYHTVIFHLGDHDPSGLDMTRDIRERMLKFLYKNLGDDGISHYAESHFEVRRLGLELDQVHELNLIPNVAKKADARWQKYVDQTGETSSWELDALDPTTMNGLITAALDEIRDIDRWNDAVEEENRDRAYLRKLVRNWGHVVDTLDNLTEEDEDE